MSGTGYCYRSYGIHDRTCTKPKGHKGKHGTGFPGISNPTLDDLKRDKEAMAAIRYLREHYTVGEILAVYMVPALDKPNTGEK